MFSYRLSVSENIIWRDGSINYRSICNNQSLCLNQFILEKSESEFINYNIAHPLLQDISLVVVFSNNYIRNQESHKKYAKYDCLLWINPLNQNFSFRIMNKPIKSSNTNTNFNIKSKKTTFESTGNISTAEGTNKFLELLNRLFSNSSENYLYTEGDNLINDKNSRRINVKMLNHLNERIMNYEDFKESFMLVVSYKTISGGYDNSKNINLDIKCINKLMFFGDGQMMASFKNFEGAEIYDKTPKFAFVISNIDIDIKNLSKYLSGHTTAFCLNIKTQNYSFCNVF